MHQRRPWDAIVLSVLIALAIFIYWPLVQIRPMGGENFYILSWVHERPARALIGLDPFLYPEWRPLPFGWLWLEHRLLPLNQVWVHHAINLALWIGCSWLVYRIAERLTASITIAALAASAFVVDAHGIYTVIWALERQTSLACLFGLAAVLLVVRHAERPWSAGTILACGALLLLSAFGKEFGLTFSGALLLTALWKRDRAIGAAVAGALAVYFGLRFAMVGGATGPLCDEMGYFFGETYHCLSPALDSVKHLSWNFAASVAGMGTQALFSDTGRLDIIWTGVVVALPIILLAIWGLATGAPAVLPLIVLGNAALTATSYRTRNHVIGVAAVVILSAIGLAALRRPSAPRAWSAGATGLLVIVIAWNAVATHARVVDEVAGLQLEDACYDIAINHGLGRDYLPAMRAAFALPPLQCPPAP